MKKILNKKITYLAGFLIIVGAVLFLVMTSFRSSLQYYVTVSELQAGEVNYQNKILKVAGKASGIEQDRTDQGLYYKFIVGEGGKEIKVAYQGFVPDTFKEGSDVVVTGHLNSDGSFEASEILAKCASKYEAKLENK